MEALPYYSKVLRLLVRLGHAKNVHVINAAVSDHPATLRIKWKNEQGKRLTGRTHVTTQVDTESVIEVPAISLDDYAGSKLADREVAFIKCDDEGYELMVLRGSLGLLEAYKPALLLEIEQEHCTRNGYEPQAIFELLSKLGYRSMQIEKRNVRYVDRAS